MNPELLNQAFETAQKAWPDARPVCGLILGTGWPAAIESFTIQGSLAYRDIPGLGSTTVTGHAGQLLWGSLAGLETFIFQGRRHWYEGAGWEPVAIPLYLLKKLGAATVVLTNAAGSLRQDWQPGTLMVIDDHINAMNAQPLIGPHDPLWGERFPDQSCVYDAKLRAMLDRAAAQLGATPAHGIYLAVSGPMYETPAEVRAFRSWGADVVGSSTVPEAILANAAGMRVAGLSCITNMAAGISDGPLVHDNIHATAINTSPAMQALIKGFWKELAVSSEQ